MFFQKKKIMTPQLPPFGVNILEPPPLPIHIFNVVCTPLPPPQLFATGAFYYFAILQCFHLRSNNGQTRR